VAESRSLDQLGSLPRANEPLRSLERHLRVVGIVDDEPRYVDVTHEVIARDVTPDPRPEPLLAGRSPHPWTRTTRGPLPAMKPETRPPHVVKVNGSVSSSQRACFCDPRSLTEDPHGVNHKK